MAFLWDHFSSVWRIHFSIYFSAGFQETHSPSFYLSLILKKIFNGYRSLAWQLFYFSTLKIFIENLPSRFCLFVEKSSVSLPITSLKSFFFFFACFSDFLFVFSFLEFCYNVTASNFFLFILIRIHWPFGICGLSSFNWSGRFSATISLNSIFIPFSILSF